MAHDILYAKSVSEKTGQETFNEIHVLQELKHYLPTQTSLKDFIHHNTLHAFQGMKFYDGIFKASKAFGYQVTLPLTEFRGLYEIGRIRADILDRTITERKGRENLEEWKQKLVSKKYDDRNTPRIGALRAYWKTTYKADLDALVHPLLFRILCSYLDQGIATWRFPAGKNGFLNSVIALEQNCFTSFFKTDRARGLMLNDNCNINELLRILVGDEQYFEQYLFDQQFSHRGWSGMVATIESRPDSLLDTKIISLHDLIVFELLLEIDALDASLGNSWQPLSATVSEPPVDILADIADTELNEVFKLWQNAFEWSYYDEVIAAIGLTSNKKNIRKGKSFQAMFCIDERECSLRRYTELADPDSETFGTPGFFGVEFYFHPQNAKFYDKVCPAPVTPKYLIKELEVTEKRKHELLYTSETHNLFAGFLLSIGLGMLAAIRLFANIFRPKMSPAISNAFTHMAHNSHLTIENKSPDDKENGLQIGFTIPEMATRLEGVLRSIGLTDNFAPVVYIIGHGSSSANNPHHGAHDCGACSGRPGSVNARVLATFGNHARVRAVLAEKGIFIPEYTHFIGGLHDTAGDEIEFYDTHLLSQLNARNHEINVRSFEKALDLNAKERSRRFVSIKTNNRIEKIRKAIKDRSVSLFEPRPELGHGTNSLCIVGHRNRTKGLFLDRRAFLNSYDYKADPEGKILSGILKPLGPVCGGINLEYYFSRVDNHKLGAGTKLPHNVMGLLGVSNGNDGDLLPGLPLQMIEVHDPVRLLLMVEHFPDVVLNTIRAVPEMYEWYINEWVHLMVMEPGTGKFHYFKDGQFEEYTPLTRQVNKVEHMQSLMETTKAMETNQTVDATRENLPVYAIN